MAAAEPLREGIEIWVRCRVGKVYDPPNPSLVTLTLSGDRLLARFTRRPSVAVYAMEIEWQPAAALAAAKA